MHFVASRRCFYLTLYYDARKYKIKICWEVTTWKNQGLNGIHSGTCQLVGCAIYGAEFDTLESEWRENHSG